MPVQRLPTGIDLYYETHGRGEPLVLIPATGFAADVWLPEQVPALAKSIQVIVFDPRGCGRSTHAGGVYTIEQMAHDTVALLDHMARHTWEATHRLGEVKAPTLVVIGDQDVIGSNHVPQAEVLASRIPGAAYNVLKGRSHGFFWEAPDETNAWILDWVLGHQ